MFKDINDDGHVSVQDVCILDWDKSVKTKSDKTFDNSWTKVCLEHE